MEGIAVLQQVLAGGAQSFQPANLLVMLAGLVVGIIGGMLPGISTVTTVALFVPFTFAMPADMAFIGLGAVFCGAMYGGANSAILINTPGQPASIATAFDGYPMTRKGRAEEALYLALLASAFGGIFGSLVLLFFFDPLSRIALEFGSEAFFWMGIFGLTTLASMFPGQVLKGLLGGAVGLAVSTVGLDPSTAMPRFTFGTDSLIQGLDMVAVMIGLFSLSQMFVILESDEKYIAALEKRPGAFRAALRGLRGALKKMLVSSGIGTFIGALPGAGGNVASIVAYNEARRWDKEPERYGTGVPEGVLVPESANNASVGGALVPLLSLGIPGSATAAVLAGGLMAQGVTPGPQLMELAPDLAYTFIASLIIANLGMIPVGYVLARMCTRILDVPKLSIIPAVISLSLLGSYALRSNMFDVLVMLVSGGIAYLLLKARIMPAAVALGLVLGSIIEESLVVTMMRSKGKETLFDLLVLSPLSLAFIGASLLAVLVPLYLNRRKGGPRLVPGLRFSLAALRRYDFWVVACLGLAGLFFLRESLALDGVSRCFPLAVYAVISLLSAGICLLMFFERAPQEAPGPGRRARLPYAHIAAYMGMTAACYALIGVVGFYAACFAGMVGMTAYGVFRVEGRPVTARETVKLLAYALGAMLLQYAGFTLLLGVQAPRGLLI